MEKYADFASAKWLPPIPSSIKPLPYGDGEDGQVKAIVVAGLNLIGASGYMCPTVSIISFDEESGELFGWSLCLGNPDTKPGEELYFFRASADEDKGTARGTELPNTTVYFQAEIDESLAQEGVDSKKLDEIMAYALPYISDEGPPPASGKSFDDLVANVKPTSNESDDAKMLMKNFEALLDCCQAELADGWKDYWDLFEELNRRFHESALHYAWKSNPGNTHYNPELGLLIKSIAGRTVTTSIGLTSDRFSQPCAVVQITPTD